ncbi:MAG: ABC transporter ATP-binding protein [Clostridium sp.]
MIEIENLKFNYDKELVLDNINLSIEKHTTCAVIGPSGCGKTTLLYCLAGLLASEEGKIIINDKEIIGIRRETGVILQHNGLLPWKTVWDNVALGLKSRNVDKKIIKTKVDEILNSLGIFEQRNKVPGQLSGGQKQRVAIARTLITEPDLLLLDEASSALDAITKEGIQNIILDTYNSRKITLVMVTHNIEEAVFLGQKIIVMNNGKIKDIVENKYFGNEDIRSKPEFYDICIKVRKLLYEGVK